jgi:hypothetical protein
MLNKIAERKLFKKLKHLIVVILPEKPKVRGEKIFPKIRTVWQSKVVEINNELGPKESFRFRVDDDILDFADLLSIMEGYSLDRIQRIEALFEENFGAEIVFQRDGKQARILCGVPDFPK